MNLTFKSEEERLAHPIAGKIPYAMWHNLFGNEITEEQLQWVETPWNELRKKNYDSLIRNRWQLSLLVIMRLFHPEISSQEWWQFSTRSLKYSPEDSFAVAAALGQIDILEDQEKFNPKRFQAMIANDKFQAYREAAENGQLAVMKHLEEKAPGQIQAMMEADDFDAYRMAVWYGHLELIQHLLTFAYTYDYAERHYLEGDRYRDCVMDSSLKFLQTTHELRANFDPQGVFDFNSGDARADQHQALYGYYVLRHLIRQLGDNQYGEAVYTEIERLLMIPSIKALVIHNATQTNLAPNSLLGNFQFARQSNELLRLAQIVGDPVVIQQLLSIPEILAQTQRSNFYAGRSAINLQEMVRDRESSMTGLTPIEQKKLCRIEEAYKNTVKNYKDGVNGVMAEIRKELETLFLAPENLAQREVICRGVRLEMPFSHKEFQALIEKYQPTENELKAWNEVYYRNPFHTAWRYLAKPNLWMDPNASYVYVSDDKKQRWSTFEEYCPLMAYLYCAAKDEAQPPTKKNMSIQDRVELFFRALSLINRQHNWDEPNRQKLDAQGNPIPGQTEEYDDMRGDRPSCFSGVKRNLFQALMHHPLYKFKHLDAPVAKAFIKGQIRAHYVEALSRLSLEELKEIKEAIDNVIQDFAEETDLLKSLRWTDINAIRMAMEKEYPGQAIAFDAQIPMVLYCMDEPGGRQKPNALINYYADCSLNKLLDDLISEKQPKPRM